MTTAADRWARVWAFIYVAGAAISFTEWLFRRPGRQQQSVLDVVFEFINTPVTQSLLAAVVCALVAVALIRRKRIGLLAVAIAQVFGIYIGIASLFHLPLIERMQQWWNVRTINWVLGVVSVPVGVIILTHLWLIREAFPARIRQGSWLRSVGALLGGLSLTVGITAWMLLAIGRDPETLTFEIWRVVGRVMSFQVVAPGLRVVPIPGWLIQTTTVLLTVTLILTVLIFLSTAKDPHGWTGEQEIRLRRLLSEYGGTDSLDYLATRRDRSAVFSPDGKAAVTYRVFLGVCLASGDPIGDPHSWPAAIQAWLRESRSYGWVPAMMSLSVNGARALVATGLYVIYLGDEAVLDAASYASGGFPRDIRRAVRRAAAQGVTVKVTRQCDLSQDDLVQLTELAERWRQGGPERGFSMALDRWGDAADDRITHVVASLPTGEPCALLSFVPWGTSGASLDVMRRSPDAPNGINELMITELLGSAEGIKRISLNFCMFRRTFAETASLGAGTGRRFDKSLLGLLSRFWQMERLYRNNRRYDPVWSPRYLGCADIVSVPLVALAVGIAEGFVPWPVGKRAHRRYVLTAEHVEQAQGLGMPREIEVPVRVSEMSRVRHRHLAELNALGVDGYPAAEIRPETRLADLAARQGQSVSVAARIARIRDHGGVAFFDLMDGESVFQGLADAATLGRDRVRKLSTLLDRGDIVVFEGVVGASRNGTPSLLLTSWTVAAKSLRQLPDSGWTDPDMRARRRSDDLLVYPSGMRVLRDRTAAVRVIRQVLDADGYLEVETPILHTVHGGATARPFTTYMNATGLNLSLRIAPELYLKRLIVAGMGPLYEIGRNFRNEGMDATHNPEFTVLEAYQPFADYDDMRQLTQRLIRAAATAVHGRPVLIIDGEEIDLEPEWPVVSVLDAVSLAVGETITMSTPADRLRELAAERDIDFGRASTIGAMIEELYSELVEPLTVRPTFYIDFPADTSPLTRPHRSEAGLAERWDLVVDGHELGTAYTELTDPLEQRRRLTAQSLQAAAGDPEAMEVDEDFLAALELGMPPTGGLGLGIDRLVMLLTAQQIRGVLTFPLVRPQPSGNQ